MAFNHNETKWGVRDGAWNWSINAHMLGKFNVSVFWRLGRHKCREEWPDGKLERAYTVFLDVILLVLPLGIMTVNYSLITWTLWHVPGTTSSNLRGKLQCITFTAHASRFYRACSPHRRFSWIHLKLRSGTSTFGIRPSVSYCFLASPPLYFSIYQIQNKILIFPPAGSRKISEDPNFVVCWLHEEIMKNMDLRLRSYKQKVFDNWNLAENPSKRKARQLYMKNEMAGIPILPPQFRLFLPRSSLL